LMMLRPENHRDEVLMSGEALDIGLYSIHNQDCCLTKVDAWLLYKIFSLIRLRSGECCCC